MSEQRYSDKALEAAAEMIGPHIDIRCGQCAGTGSDLRSNLDCTACDATGCKVRDRPWRATIAREVAAESLDAATDPSLGPDALVRVGDVVAILRAGGGWAGSLHAERVERWAAGR